MKKLITLLIAGILSVGALVFPGCAPKTGLESGDNVINVKVLSTGYGTEYIYNLKEKFEETFAEKGYKVNVLAPLEDLTGEKIIQEIYANDVTADLYFTNAGASTFCESELGIMIESLEDVYNSKPIGFDGKEENITIREKLDATKVNYGESFDGTEYTFPYVAGYSGLAVNVKLLSDPAIDSEIPVTTNEFFKVYEKIMAITNETNIRPMTYSVSGNGYPTTAVNTWQVQYGGMKEYDIFNSFENEDGTSMDCRKTNCDGSNCNGHVWEVFNSEAVLEALTAFYTQLDYNTAALGSSSQGFTAAQQQLMTGSAAFMNNGTWLLNEEKDRHKDYLNDVSFMRIPLLSSVGIKMFGQGSKYNLSDDKCEEVLSTIAKNADLNKNVDEIKTIVKSSCGLDIDEADVKEVCEKRGYIDNQSGSPAVLSKKAQNKELAKLFLRFIASNDAGKVFAEASYNLSPWCADAFEDSELTWFKDLMSIYNNQYTSTFAQKDPKGFRRDLGLAVLYPWAGDVVSNKILEQNYKFSIYDDNTKQMKGNYSEYKEKAKAFQKNIVDHAYEMMTTNGWTVI